MIRDLGIVQPGSTLYIPFHTFDSNDPSASVTLTGLATTDIEIYKDGSTTQRASDAGYALLDTDGIDFDAITGIHGISINLADNSTAGFYASGSQYWVVISSVTVDAATINFVLCTFRIGYPGARLDTTIATLSSQTSFTLTSGPAEDDALNGFYCLIHDVASAVQEGHAVISDYVGSTRTVTLAAATTFTIAASDNISIMGPAPLQPTVAARTLDVSTGGEAGVDWANVGTPGSTVSLSSTTVATVSTATAVTTVNGLAANTITATSIANDAITAAKIATGAIDADALATDAVTEITDATKTALGVVSGTADSGTTTTMVDAALTQADTDYWKGSTIVFTSGTISGQARLITGFNAATDTVTFAPATTQAVGTNTYIIVPAARVDVELWDGSAVNALSSGRVDVTVGAMQADTITSSALATTAVDEIVDATWDEATSGHTTAGTTGKALTDAGSAGDPWSTALPGAYGAGTAGNIVGNNLNATVSSRLPTANITLSGGAVTVGTNNDKTGYSLANGAITAAVVATGAIDADALATDAVTEITDATKTALGIVTGTADSGTTTTMVDAALTQADTDYWKGSLIVFTSGTISGQARLITGFTPASDTVTFSPATTQAVGTNTYIIIPKGRVDIELWQGSVAGTPATTAAVVDAVWDEALSGHTTAGTAGKALSDAGSAGDPWSTALPGAYGAGTAGKIIGDNINATISSRLPTANISLSGGAVTVGTNNDKTGYSLANNAITAAVVATGAIDADALATDAVTEITDATKTALGVVTGTADSGTTTTMVDAALTQADTDYWKGSLIVFTSGTISGQARLITGFTPASDTVTFAPATTQAVGTNTYIIVPAGRVDVELWDGSAVNALSSGRVDVTVGAMQTNVVTATALDATAGAEIADAVWDEATSGHATAGSTGKALTDALANTAEIGVAGAGLTNINLPDQTMNITGNITGNVSGSVGSVTGNVGGNVVGSVGSVASAGITDTSLAVSAQNAIADAVLDRNMATGVDSGTNTTAVRTPRQALRALRNKVTVSGGVATVTKEDDASTSWTAAVTTTAGNPVSGVDPT